VRPVARSRPETRRSSHGQAEGGVKAPGGPNSGGLKTAGMSCGSEQKTNRVWRYLVLPEIVFGLASHINAREAIRTSDAGVGIRTRGFLARNNDTARVVARAGIPGNALPAHAGQHRFGGREKGLGEVVWRATFSGDAPGSYRLLDRGPVTGKGALLFREER
jgi:hypothetical protein